jgi:4'-phosphopantetheinyl transferase
MKICLLSTDIFLRSDKEFEQALSSLPFGERDKENLLKKKNRVAACESLGARVALMHICGRYDFGTLETTENGKPYFSKSHAPFFSLSHTKGLAAAALCERKDGLIGIDIEIINSNKDLSNIAKRFFYPDELLRYENSKDPESFYSVWTEKEARVKLFGKNLSSELSKKENKKESLFLYKYKVKFAQSYAILCVASEQEQKEIIFINDEDFEIYGLQN